MNAGRNAGRAVRSKFATDLNFRLWDETRSRWVTHNGRNIWATKGPVETLRAKLILEEGRNPETLSVERVQIRVL